MNRVTTDCFMRSFRYFLPRLLPRCFVSRTRAVFLLGGMVASLAAPGLPELVAQSFRNGPINPPTLNPPTLNGRAAPAPDVENRPGRGDSPNPANSLTAPTGETGEIESIVVAGLEYERDGRWGEALFLYQQALKDYPQSNRLKQRRAISRIHFELQRRYADAEFVATISATPATNALNLYAEVLLKIESYHVDEPNWASLARHGLASLEIAINDADFRQRYLGDVGDQQIAGMVKWLRNAMSSYQVRNRQDAYVVASNSARTAQQRLNLPIGISAYEFISGAIVALDTYSAFLSENQYSETMSQIEGNFVGLGVELNTSDNELEVVNVIQNGPAGQAGIMGGDLIIAIDDRPVADIGSEKAADLLRGPAGSTVRLMVQDPDNNHRTYKLRRKHVAIPSVEGVRIVDPEQAVGYIRVTNFQKTTPRDFDAALWNLQQQGMKHLIVDLRGNPGGLLSASVEMADRFIKSGIIVSTKGRNPMEDFTHRAKATGTWRIPLVVLIDENSASASEIFAAAIADHQRGTIVGQRSYGKGSVQGIFPLNINGGGIRLTTAKFYSPKGREIHLHGVTPAVNVEHVAKPAIGSFTAEDTDVILRTGIQVCRQLTDTKSLAGR